MQNDATIRLNRSIERKYKLTNNERTMVTEQNPHLVAHANSWKVKSANLAVTRANLQLQGYKNHYYLDATAIPSFLKCPCLVVEKNSGFG